MIVPKNHHKLQAISECVSDELKELEQIGIPYHHEWGSSIARKAINTCMPELVDIAGERIVIEAVNALSIENGTIRMHHGVHTGGLLAAFGIQQVFLEEAIEDIQLESTRLDLFAVVTPTYTDPDPQEIVFSPKLYIPFSDITAFEAA